MYTVFPTSWIMTFFLPLMMMLGSCKEPSIPKIEHRPLPKTWYEGKAELSLYDLQQHRYGEVHQGESVLIFVTEDFSRSKHVKLDNPDDAGDDAVKVMKLNATRKFNTGLYPYSVMTSVFTPVELSELPATLKLNVSVQEWCGHVFSQMNKRNGGYVNQGFSYFESEGDQKQELPNMLLEDELWNLIRIDPDVIPTGRLLIMPGKLYHRFSHKQPEASTAEITMDRGDLFSTLTVDYQNIDRILTIRFSEVGDLYAIEGWVEGSKTNEEAKTTATLRNRMWLDYWKYNQTQDSIARDQLYLQNTIID